MTTTTLHNNFTSSILNTKVTIRISLQIFSQVLFSTAAVYMDTLNITSTDAQKARTFNDKQLERLAYHIRGFLFCFYEGIIQQTTMSLAVPSILRC